MAGPGLNATASLLSAANPASTRTSTDRRIRQLERKVIYFLYRAVQAIAAPLILLYFLNRGLRDRRYFYHFAERLGLLPPPVRRTIPGGIWLHAVSVGEVLSATPLLTRLRQELPGVKLHVSCSTLAGRSMAGQKLTGLADSIFYAPLDYCFAVRRILRTLRPAVVVVMETEIWPNLYQETRRAGARLLVVNGRISDRAIPRYRRFAWFFRPVLSLPDAILAQTEISAGRYRELGAARVEVAGNLKYDFTPHHPVPLAVATFLERNRPAATWIAASTMPPAQPGDPDEDEVVIQAYLELRVRFENLLLILVPRRPERFDSAAAKLEAAGIPFARRSRLIGTETAPVLLLDSMGELSGLFAIADVVFMGGTFPHRGGHNILEPAFFGKPVICGPHMENFPEIAADFLAGQGMVEAREPAALASAVADLLNDPEACQAIGARARDLAEAKRGATTRIAQAVVELERDSLPAAPGYPLMTPLSALWTAAARLRPAPRRLATPVVSIGNITLGGAGKSPFVLWLARNLPGSAILTRGYRRQTTTAASLFAIGDTAPVSLTGDEPQIFLRRSGVPLGIGADRFAVGRRMEQRFQPKLFLLDDALQHTQLARDLDIVLIDALDPFGAGRVVPAGRLREPLSALARAGAFLITRAARPPRPAIERVLRAHNPNAPVFYCRVIPERWVDAVTAEELPLHAPPPDAAAFCGLANPAAFWQTLDALGCHPAARHAFGDHHRYTTEELASLGASTLLTTEKDAMNLPARVPAARILWLRIGIEIDRPAELLQLIGRAVRRASA